MVEGDDSDNRTLDTMKSEAARQHIDSLKESFLRLMAWDKSTNVYRELIDELTHMPEYKNDPEWKMVSRVDQWNIKEPPSETLGKYAPPRSWGFTSKQSPSANGKVRGAPRGSGSATSNWDIHRPSSLIGS